MKPIICRLKPHFWWIVALSLLVSLAFIFGPSRATEPPESRVTILAGLIAGIFGLLVTGYLAADLARGEVRADDTGLQWRRGFRAHKSARWDEIGDFYIRFTANGTHFIETPAGKLGVDTSFVGIDKILSLIPQRAVNARAREWELHDYRRDEQWEQTLPVWTKSQKWAAPCWMATSLYLVGYFGYLILFGPKKLTLSPDFQWFDILITIVGLLFFGVLGIMSVVPAIMSWRERKFAWVHRDETLRMNARGIVFISNEKRVEAAWDEVQSVERTENKNSFRGYRVTTKNGEFVHWANNASFRARGEHYAPDAFQSMRADEAAESLDGELNPSPASEDGAQTFSFRTRGNRLAVGTISLALWLAPPLYLINIYNNVIEEQFAPSWPLFGALCAVAILVSGALCLWFSRTHIVADGEGLRLHSPFRSVRRIAWEEIESSDTDMWGHWLRVKGRKIYWARVISPARKDELKHLIGIQRPLQT